MLVEGVRGPSPERWCPCGNHQLEIVGTFRTDRTEINHLGDEVYVYEYSHTPKCPVCQDEERRGISTGASVGSLRG